MNSNKEVHQDRVELHGPFKCDVEMGKYPHEQSAWFEEMSLRKFEKSAVLLQIIFQ